MLVTKTKQFMQSKLLRPIYTLEGSAIRSMTKLRFGKKNWSSSVIVLVLFSLLFSSCGLFHKVVEGDSSLRHRTARSVLKKVKKQQANWSWLEAKIKLDVQMPQQHIKLTAYLRMQRDEAIWMSFKKLGMEVGRLYLASDSVFFINRLERTYFAERLSDLAKAYNIPAGFYSLQELLAGYPAELLERPNLLVVDGGYCLVEERGEFIDTLWIDGRNFLSQSWSLHELHTGLEMKMEFENYQKLDAEHFFSYFRVLEALSEGQEELLVEFEFGKVRLNEPVNMPFQIPQRYERMR